MSNDLWANNLHKQFYNNLNLRDTEDLLEIWRVHDTESWQPEVFEMVEQILTERMGYPPPPPSADEIQRLEGAVQSREEAKAVEEEADMERQDQTVEDLAAAYTRRGISYDEAGDVDKALADFREAVRIEPETEEAWNYLATIEAELEDEFQNSEVRERLDRAFQLTADDDPLSAQVEVDAALRAGLPEIAAAYNALGNVYQALEQFQPALDAYLHAIRLNGHYYDARENLATARLRLEEEQFTQSFTPDEDDPDGHDGPDDDDDPDNDDADGDDDPLDNDPPEPPDMGDYEAGGPAPAWVYLSRQSYLLAGWPGHRTLPGRSGWDPLDTDFEAGHTEGVILRLLFTRRLRTHQPVYLLVMAIFCLLFSTPLLLVIDGLNQGVWSLIGLLYLSPYLAVGVALLVNIMDSFSPKPDGYEENGSAFF